MFHLAAADIQALRRRSGPGNVLSASRHGLGPEAVLPNAALAAESRSRRWESQAQSARREGEMPRLAWRPGHGQPLARGCVHQDFCLPLSQRPLDPSSRGLTTSTMRAASSRHLLALLHHITRADPRREANHLSPKPHLPL